MSCIIGCSEDGLAVRHTIISVRIQGLEFNSASWTASEIESISELQDRIDDDDDRWDVRMRAALDKILVCYAQAQDSRCEPIRKAMNDWDVATEANSVTEDVEMADLPESIQQTAIAMANSVFSDAQAVRDFFRNVYGWIRCYLENIGIADNPLFNDVMSASADLLVQYTRFWYACSYHTVEKKDLMAFNATWDQFRQISGRELVDSGALRAINEYQLRHPHMESLLNRDIVSINKQIWVCASMQASLGDDVWKQIQGAADNDTGNRQNMARMMTDIKLLVMMK